MLCFVFIFIGSFFFFKQKTAYEMRISDWSSDVCSSDLRYEPIIGLQAVERNRQRADQVAPELAPQMRTARIEIGVPIPGLQRAAGIGGRHRAAGAQCGRPKAASIEDRVESKA